MKVLETDYLIVGAGAAGMAFADALIAECAVDVVMVERRHRPGGHWNDAYPFVRIHHASACYGVNSRVLGSDSIDQFGPNSGCYECASSTEVLAYFQRVLDEVLIASGQVRFYAMSEYIGDWANNHVFVSRLTGEKISVRVRRKIVDTTYLDVTVPATHVPSFKVDPTVKFIPVGELVNVASRPPGYTVLGSGKTAMDACNWLLNQGEDPDRIRWIRPRDGWLLDRMTLQPRNLVAETIDSFSTGVEILAQATSLSELFSQLDARKQIFRLDPHVVPTMFRGAILSDTERQALMQIERVVRQGHVQSISRGRITLSEGDVSTNTDEIFIDCTASGFRTAPVRPIFEPQRIIIQSLIGGLTTYNAALIAFIESTARDDVEKNRLCPPVAQFNLPIDWIRYVRGVLLTSVLHSREPDIAGWQNNSRLNITYGLDKQLGDQRIQNSLNRWQSNSEQALANADRLLA